MREEVEGPEPLTTTRGRWAGRQPKGPPEKELRGLLEKRLVYTGVCRPIDGGLARPSDRVRWGGPFGSDLEAWRW